jgi:5-(carboxyamino)imidazole ribonucleotide mutase
MSDQKVHSLAKTKPLVGVIMGSKTDHETMQTAIELLEEFGVPFEAKIVSAHRTPDQMFKYASGAESRGIKVIIAAAGGAAHLPGMTATKTTLPVLGVPISSTELNGLDSLLSIAQMPKGIPVGTLAVGKPGAANAALLAMQILALNDKKLSARLKKWRESRTQEVMKQVLR